MLLLIPLLATAFSLSSGTLSSTLNLPSSGRTVLTGMTWTARAMASAQEALFNATELVGSSAVQIPGYLTGQDWFAYNAIAWEAIAAVLGLLAAGVSDGAVLVVGGYIGFLLSVVGAFVSLYGAMEYSNLPSTCSQSTYPTFQQAQGTDLLAGGIGVVGGGLSLAGVLAGENPSARIVGGFGLLAGGMATFTSYADAKVIYDACG